MELTPYAGLLTSRLPLLTSRLPLLTRAFRSGRSCNAISWVCASSHGVAKHAEAGEADTKTVKTDVDSGEDPTTLASAPCVSPGGLRAAKLCGLTGLCSRTKVNIINTNMRCPSCLLDVLDKHSKVTFFPAVPIESTVRLAHIGAYSTYVTALETLETCSSASNGAATTLIPLPKGAVPAPGTQVLAAVACVETRAK